MRPSPKHRVRIVAAIIVGLLGTLVIAGIRWNHRNNAGRPDPATMTALHRLEQVWTSFPNRHAGKKEYGRACGALHQAIDQCTPDELRGIIRYNVTQFTDAPSARRRNDFEFGYLSALEFVCLESLITKRDREQLLFVLTRVPVDRIGFVVVETALGYDFSINYADNDPWKPDDLFTLLFDAFDKAETPGARASALAAIQRSFRDQTGDPESGAPYVAKCRDWFHQNFSHIEAVREHLYVYGDEPWKEVKPLYVLRETK